MAGWKLAHRQHLKFCHFQHVHFAGKNPLSPKVMNRFSKSFHQLEDVVGEHSGVKFQVRRCLTFAMARWKLCASKTFKILPLLTCTLCQQKSYISKGIQPILEIFPQLEDVEGGHLGGKFQVRTCFNLAMATWKLCASTTFEILSVSTCTRCRQKSCICKAIQPIFEIFSSARRCWGWTFVWKDSCEQVFCDCSSMVKTLRIDNI